MKKRRLDQYRGHLTPAAVASGINAARNNAERLLGDARLLADAERFPTAAALAILAIEEAGKASILRSLVLARNPEDLKEGWRDYRSHTKKNVSWILPQLAANGARTLEEMRPIFDRESNHPEELDYLKQVALYTDCLGDAHWSVPEEVVDKHLASWLVQIAGALVKDREVTTEEIELWIEHVGPVWKREVGWMKTALTNWHAAMVARGLAPDDDSNFERFVWG